MPSKPLALNGGHSKPLYLGPNPVAANDHIIPDVILSSPPGTGLVPQSELDPPEISDQQLNVAAAFSPIPLAYGRVRLGGRIIQPVTLGTGLLVPMMLAQGEIDAVEAVEIDNKALPPSITVTHYLGTAGQGVNANLAAAWASHGKTYADTLPGIAYSVAAIPDGADLAFENIAFRIRGLKVYDPRDGTQVVNNPTTWKWSDNSALCLAHFLSAPGIGPEEVMDWASVTTCANVNDELCGAGPAQEKRRRIGLLIDQQTEVTEVENLLRAHAGCWVVREGGVTRLVMDAPASPTVAFVTGNYRKDTVHFKKRGRLNAPTVVTIQWTNTAVTPWITAETTEMSAGVDVGTTPFLESVVAMPGIPQPGQAKREAIRRLREAELCDLTVDFVAMDAAAALMTGDVFTLSDIEGFTMKPFRCIDVAPIELGRWRVSGSEYQAGVYSDSTDTAPTTPDTSIPDPANPPQVASLTLTEELFQTQGVGLTRSRIKAVWPEPAYPFLQGYRVEVVESGKVIQTDTVRKGVPEYRTPDVQELKTYTVNVYTISWSGASSVARFASKLAEGKLLAPQFPIGATLDAFEVGGEVIASWTRAADLDTLRYELRYGAVGTPWATLLADPTKFLDRVDSERTRIRGVIPEGTWTLWVAALDSVGNYSTTQLSRNLTVTSDAGAFISAATFISPTLTNVLAFKLRPDNRQRYITSVAADTMAAQFPNALSSYPNPIATYRTAGASTYTSEVYDIGVVVSASFVAQIDYTDLGGTAVLNLRTSTDGISWVDHFTDSVRAAARFVQLVLSTTGAFEIIDLPKIRISAVGRKEASDAPVTSAASGPRTITLNGFYAKALRITVTPRGTVARTPTVDNVVLSLVGANTFDVYLFDAAGVQVAADFIWDFEGV